MSGRDPLSDEKLYKNPLQEHYRKSFPSKSFSPPHDGTKPEGDILPQEPIRKPDESANIAELEQQKTTARGKSEIITTRLYYY